jgi:hypothetical protein
VLSKTATANPGFPPRAIRCPHSVPWLQRSPSACGTTTTPTGCNLYSQGCKPR